MLEIWDAADIKIFTFSKSKKLVQKMLFAFSIFPKTHNYITDYISSQEFGSTRRASSFRKIANEIETRTANIVFFSDDPIELRAARKAGCKTILVIRRHNKKYIDTKICDKYRYIETFEQIELIYDRI